MQKVRIRNIIWALLIGIVILALVLVFWPRPAEVDVVTITQERMDVLIHQDGKTRVRDVYTITAPLTGQLKRIELEPGDPVVAGETVLTRIAAIDPSILDTRSRVQQEKQVTAAEAAVRLANAELTQAVSEQRFAEHELERNQVLAANGTISERALERFEIDLRGRNAAVAAARAALAMRQSDLETARAALIGPDLAARDIAEEEYVDIRARQNGVILQVYRESAGIITSGERLVDIGDPARLEIVADLLSADAVAVAEGARVHIRDWGGEGILTGTVRRIEPFGYTKVSALGIEEQRVDVIIDLDDPQDAWRRLGHGYRVKVDIITWSQDNVLTAPVSTLFRDGDGWAVFKMHQGRAVLTPISVGQMTNRQAQVLSGLNKGDILIEYPTDLITDGARITRRGSG